MPPNVAAGSARVCFGNKSRIGANISGGFRVYKSMQDEATALVRGPAGADRGTETTEVTMFSGWNSHVMERIGAGRLAGQSANTLSVYPMRL